MVRNGIISNMSYSPIKVTDWISFTPVTNLTNLNSINGKYRRNGTCMKMAINAAITSSTSMAGGIWFGLPTGFTAGESTVFGLGGDFLADVVYQDIDFGRYRGSAVVLISWESPQKIHLQSIGTNGVATAISSTIPFTWANGDRISLYVPYLPIAEWGG